MSGERFAEDEAEARGSPSEESVASSRSRSSVILAVIAIVGVASLWLLTRYFLGWDAIVSPYGGYERISFRADEARFFVALVPVQALLLAALMKGIPARGDQALRRLTRELLANPSRTYFALALMGMAIALTFALFITVAHPITEDEKTYLFQSQLLRSGHFVSNILPDEANVFAQPFIVARDGHWSGQYFWAQPAILAIFNILGSPWLAPPIELALTIGFSAHAAATLCNDARAGVLTAALMATSPFLLLNAATLLNVNLAATCLAASLWAIAELRERPSRIATIVLGLSTGIAIHNRPFDHAAFIVPVAAILLLERPRAMSATIRRYLPSIVIALPFLVAVFFINKSISGNAWIDGRAMFNGPRGWKTFGFGHGPFGEVQTPATAASKTIANVVRVTVFLSGSVILVAIASMGAFFAQASRAKTIQRVAALLIVIYFGAYFIYCAPPISPVGPIYFVSIAPVICILVATGVLSLRDVARPLAPDSMWLPKALLALMAVAIFTFWPSVTSELHRLATQSPAARAESLAAASDLHHALVFVAMPEHPKQEFAEQFTALPHPSFDDDILYAPIGDKDVTTRVAARFGIGREVYLIESKEPMTIAHFDPITGRMAPLRDR
jgi:hypothetical protein